MIEPQEILPTLVQCCPDFYGRLTSTVENWLVEDGSISPCALMTELEGFVATRLRRDEYDYLSEIFALIERYMLEGSQDVRDAAATCFLENLINQSGLDSTLWTSLLGKESRECCKAWDNFTGVKTPGL
jgi:hypothetical protein